MYGALSKIQWTPSVKIVFGGQSIPSENGSPWLELSEVFSGLFLTCEQALCNRANAQKHGIALILTLNGGDYVAPYRVYEYSSDAQCCIYTKLPSFEAFVSQLDEYTSADIPEDVQLRKVFIRSIPAEDSPSYDIWSHFSETCTLIELVMVNRRSAQIRSVCLPAVAVHCLVGVSRSVAVVMAYIMKRTGHSRDDVFSLVQKARSVANPNPGFQTQLFYWEKVGYCRVVDNCTASLVANELHKGCKLDTFLGKYFPFVLLVQKLVSDRKLFGLVIAEADLGEDDLGSILAEVSSCIASLIADGVYEDVPGFFDNVCEMIASLTYHVPAAFALTENKTGICFDDVLYYEMYKRLGSSGDTNYSSDMVKAFCSFIEAIAAKHLANNPLGRPQVIGFSEKVSQISFEELRLSFPFLPFLAPFAAGFVHHKQVEILREGKWTREETQSTLNIVLNVFQKNFLLTASGTDLSFDASSTASRWHSASRIGYLESDMEVRILERVEAGSTLLAAATPYLQLDHLDPSICLIWVRKLTGAVVGTRLFYDVVDRYFNERYRDQIPDDMVVAVANRIVPWEEVFEILQCANTVYSQKCEDSLDLLAWIKAELSSFISGGIVTFPM